MSFTKTQLVLIGIGLVITLFIILIFIGVIPGLRSNDVPDVVGELTIWGVADDAESIGSTLISKYNELRPAVAVTYIQKNADNYEEEIINALASGRGPDAYFIKNTWVLDQADRLSPLTQDQYPRANLRAAFPSVVEQNVAPTEAAVFGFPLSIDTLALFYNKTLFDNAGIANPPTTWQEIVQMVPRLRSVDATNKIQRAAIALGGSQKSVLNAADIISLFMLQDGVVMNEERGYYAAFARSGEDSLRRYLEFSNPASELYTWNDQMGSDVEAFAAGKLAMMIGYQEDMARIKEKNPFFEFEVAPLPQLAGADLATNYASYWVLVVPKTSNNVSLAWDFIGTVSLNPEIARTYLELTGRSPALRSLISESVDKLGTGFFARQTLTAKSWLQPSGSEVEEAFSKMIESVLTGKMPPRDSLLTAEESINDIIRRKIETSTP